MFCQHCGNELNSSAKFCSNCGAKIRSAKKISAPILVLIIVLTVVLLIVGAYYARLLFGSTPPEGSTQQTDTAANDTAADIDAGVDPDVDAESGTDFVDILHQFTERSETLWNKDVSYELVKLPESAFLYDARCTGLAPDGVTFLFGGTEGAYLWNMDTDEITFIYSANEDTDAQLRRIYNENHASGGGEALSGSELLRSALTRYRDDSLCAFHCVSPQPYIDDAYLFVRDWYFGYPWLIDARSGALYACVSQTDEAEFGGIYDSTLLYYSQSEGRIMLKDLDSGHERYVNLAAYTSFGQDDALLLNASFLPDGSICAVFCSGAFDYSASLSSEQELVISAPVGSAETYQLGRAALGTNQMYIICANADYLVLYSRTYATKVPPLLVNRVTGEVSMLGNEEGVVTALSFDAVTHTFGAEEDSDWYSFLIPVCHMSDGVSILLINGDGYLVLFRPDTMQTLRLLDDAFPLLITDNSGNHYDRFVSPGAYGYEEYLQFIVK